MRAENRYFVHKEFKADNQEQLALSVGQILYIKAKPTEEWWLAESNGLEGLVPVDHLEEFEIGNN